MDPLRRKSLEAIAIATLVFCVAAAPVFAQSTTVQVPGTANPYLAGMPPGATCCASETGEDRVPEQQPTQVTGIPITPGAALTFNVSGSVSHLANQAPIDSPDGGAFFEVRGVTGTPSSNGIASMNAPVNALVGVFLDNSQPNDSATPPGIDFGAIGLSFPSLSPGLKQVFFIGDGRTGTGTGSVQQFIVPGGATRLFLGTVDGIGWHTNTGAFTVQVNTSGGAGSALAAAVLPLSRSVTVGAPATAFATIINAGGTPATGCAISPATAVPGSFLYQTTSAATNNLTGTPNTPVNIPAGGSQSFLVALTPSAAFGPTDVAFNFECSNAGTPPTIPGVNTLLLTASNGPVPDVIALAATPSNDGILNLVGGAGAFSVAAANVGASAPITVTVDTGSAGLPIALSVCQTGSGGGCAGAAAPSVTLSILANATPTFTVFAGGGPIGFDPGLNRIFIRFRDGGGVVRGATSVAVRSQ